MFGFMREVILCATAGMLLSVVFLTPTGAAMGAANGLLVGICVGLGEWKARRGAQRTLRRVPVRRPSYVNS